MSNKTTVETEREAQAVTINREFELPVDLLFLAYTEPELVEQWMGTKVIRLESFSGGNYELETTDPMGNKHQFRGVIHELVHEKRIVRTFEIQNSGLGVQLEILNFNPIDEERSQLRMKVIYESLAHRDRILKMGMTHGISLAHDRLEQLKQKLKPKQNGKAK